MASWQDPQMMQYWILAVSAIVLFLILYFLLSVKNHLARIVKEQQQQAELTIKAQRDLLKHTIIVQEEERSRIALDLHDNLISQLNIIRMLNENGEKRDSINQRLKESMITARNISHDLTPPLINEIPLHSFISNYISDLNVIPEIQFHCTQDSDSKLLQGHKIHLFRIFQEVITNGLTHANASKINIILRCTDLSTSFSISDNGKGYKSVQSSGLGLKNIESRAQFLTASYKFNSAKGKGTRFIISLNNTNL
ncbi:MAG: hypothetical protein HRT58_14670 [Crocinitomicaceae bacterium]|nr:hypothetical protein [Flavobacteriales bacterium]NQZ36911.1 hypothetical protein [Crocinitomicaceae bacterium]